jgi:phospholipase C
MASGCWPRVSWRIYQDMADNFTDNPLAGFKPSATAMQGRSRARTRAWRPGSVDPQAGRPARGRPGGRLPRGVVHRRPGRRFRASRPSSPAQGADYTARVIEALTADPKVWARTVLLVMFDENDGFFDHVPPPAPPSKARPASLGGSTVDTAGEYHLVRNPTEAKAERDELMGRPYGLGPRVPLYVISPWSRGGWVNSARSSTTPR